MGTWGSTLIINIWVRFGKRPNFSHHPNIRDMSNRYFFKWNKSPRHGTFAKAKWESMVTPLPIPWNKNFWCFHRLRTLWANRLQLVVDFPSFFIQQTDVTTNAWQQHISQPYQASLDLLLHCISVVFWTYGIYENPHGWSSMFCSALIQLQPSGCNNIL